MRTYQHPWILIALPKVKKVLTKIQPYNLIVAGLDHQQRRFMMLHANIECCQTAAMFLSGVQKDRLVHGDSYWQPSP
jgi:hypothetical protein